MATSTNSTSEKSALEASFSRPNDSGFGKADRMDHSYADSYSRSLAVDPAAADSHVTEDTLLDYLKATLARHHDIDAAGIHIELRNGEVFLTGSVPSASMISLAEDVVQRVQGVQGVTNRLSVLS